MKKTITVLGAIAIAGSPVLVLSVAPYRNQNLQNILQVTANPNIVVNNDIIVQAVKKSQFNFEVHLSNSTYNGFPGFMSQISIQSIWPQREWGIFFFQWLNDNSFKGDFPNLQQYTKKGFYHEPFAKAKRLEAYMGHFGNPFDNKTGAAWSMVWAGTFWKTFGNNVESTYKKDATTGKLAGVKFNFSFSYANDVYGAKKPSFKVVMNQ